MRSIKSIHDRKLHMCSIKKAVFKFILVVFIIIVIEGGVRLCYESWVNQTVQSKQERVNLKGTIDTLYCGNSLTYYSFNPEILDEKLETNSFNLATASQPYIGTYYLIRDAVEENPIDKVYVTIALAPLKEKSSTKYYISGFENMRTWKWKLRYLMAVQKEDVWISSLLYTTQVENYLNVEGVKANLINKLVTKSTSSNYAGRGFRRIETEFEGRENKKNGRVNLWNGKKGEAQIQEESLTYIEKIADFCNEQGIKLTFVTLPYTQTYLDGARDLDDFNEYFKEKSEEWGADYLNFMLYKDRESVFTDEKFKDDRHMNVKGSEAFCELLAEVVRSSQPEEYFYDSMEDFQN